MTEERPDFLIAGGGVIGLTVALELKKRTPSASIHILEKEKHCGSHASGRNSGVIHAGFYYTPDSLKAKLTRKGNLLLHAFCDQHRIPVRRCGKLVVMKDESEVGSFNELRRRGERNGIPLEVLSIADAKKLEPRVRSYEQALFSPSTSSVDPTQVIDALKSEAVRLGVRIHEGRSFVARTPQGVETSSGRMSPGYFINCAGLYADKIAHAFGFSKNYRMLPFKGLYLYSSEPAGSLNVHVYPVPNLLNPFLGVHFTILSDGRFKIGPTATPIFWREQYGGIQNFRMKEILEILPLQLRLLFRSNFDFKRLAIDELLKLSREEMVRRASSMLEGTHSDQYKKWGRPGIRAQLFDTRHSKLEMDFVMEGNHQSLHVLNAVSPAFTCSLAFAELVADEVYKKMEARVHAGAELAAAI